MAMDAIKQALRLTRAGRLDEAVRVIQGGLAGSDHAPSHNAKGKISTKDKIIDLTAIPRATAKLPGSTEPPQPALHTPSRFLDCRHTGPAGSLEYCLFLPADVRPDMPLVVMLHGCTQSPEDFARGTGMNQLADKAGIIVVYPRQTQAANGQKCWNWFRPADQQRDVGEAALVAAVIADVAREHHVDRSRIYVAGLSAGGAAAANLAACYPELFAAVAVHSGLPYGAARSLPAALSAMRQGSRDAVGTPPKFVPTITFHGASDSTVNPVNSDQIVAAAKSAYGAPLTTQVEDGGKPGGRRYRRAVSRDASGKSVIEQWTIAGAGHAWSGGNSSGSYTDPTGPDASQEMLRFFLQHRHS